VYDLAVFCSFLADVHSLTVNIVHYATLLQVLQTWRPAASTIDVKTGNTPLHVAMAMGAAVETVELLLNEWDGATRHPNQSGDTALHVGMRHRAPASSIRAVFRYGFSLFLC